MSYHHPPNPIGQSAAEGRHVTAGRWADLAAELTQAAGDLLEANPADAVAIRERVGRRVALEAMALGASSERKS